MKYNELSSTAKKFLEIACHWVNVMWVSDVERELFGMHSTLLPREFHVYRNADDFDKLIAGGWVYENPNSGRVHLTKKGQQVLPKYLKAISECIDFDENYFMEIHMDEVRSIRIAKSVAKKLGFTA